MSQDNTATATSFDPTATCRHCDEPIARFEGVHRWIDAAGNSDCRSGLGLAEGHDAPPVLTPSDCRPLAPFPTYDAMKLDIPFAIASAAHAGTSFVPEKRAEQEQSSYAGQLNVDLSAILSWANTDEKRATARVEFARYRDGFRTRYLAMLSAKSRCMSTMITGGSNFPTRRNQKRSDAADKRTSDLFDFRDRAMAAIKKTLNPELRPIMAGDDDATARLRTKIAKAEEFQANAKRINATIRKHAKAGTEAQVAALVALFSEIGNGYGEATAREWLKPDFCGRIGIPSYELTNNNANIRRMKGRLAEISKAQSTEVSVTSCEHAKLEDCPADNRVRLFFPGKPDAEVRTRLKSAGFRWTPSLGCWQAYRNHNTLVVAKREAGEPEVVDVPV